MHGTDHLALARAKADVAFDLFRLVGVPFYTFHDRDVAPEGDSLAESNRNVRAIAEVFARKQEETGIGLLWGTANLFSNRRFMAGAATNPNPDVFAYAAAQVKNAMDVTRELGGANGARLFAYAQRLDRVALDDTGALQVSPVGTTDPGDAGFREAAASFPALIAHLARYVGDGAQSWERHTVPPPLAAGGPA